MTRKGRTYGCIEMVLDPAITSDKRRSSNGLHFETGDDYLVLGRQVVSVLNGTWVLDSDERYGGRLVGVAHDELIEVPLDTTYFRSPYRVLYVCHKPFGFVSTDSEARERLVYARQIHKGELGRGVRIPTLDYVRQPLASHRGLGMKTRERRRGQYGWVKLSDLGEMSPGVGHNPDKQVELVLGYWQFSGHRNYRYYENGQDGGQLVDVARGSSLDIELGNAEFESLTQEQFRKECSDTSEVWVRRGFAYTILRLQALGV